MSIEAEKGVIGCASLGALDECLSEGVNEEYFSHDQNRIIWGCINKLNEENKPIDTSTISHRLSEDGHDISIVSHLVSCEDMAPTSSNLGYWLPTLRKDALRRIYREKIARLSLALDDPTLEPDEITAKFEAEILDSKKIEAEESTRQQDMVRVLQLIEDVQYHGKQFGVSTGFDDLDRMIKGFEEGKMYVVCGRPGAGKTTLAQCFARNLVTKGIPTLIFSAEMTVDQLNMRMLSAETRINSRDLMTPKSLSRSQFPSISTQVGEMLKWPIYIRDDSDMTVSKIRAIARRMKKLKGIKAIIVDYLQLLSSDKSKASNEKGYERVGAISSGLKNMSKELNLPVIALAQLNRDTEKSDRRPKASDLRESGQIEQDADAIIALWEPDESKRPSIDHSIIEAAIVKNRYGSTGNFELLFKKDESRFEPISRFSEQDIPCN
jgi:replicative DNA helicase